MLLLLLPSLLFLLFPLSLSLPCLSSFSSSSSSFSLRSALFHRRLRRDRFFFLLLKLVVDARAVALDKAPRRRKHPALRVAQVLLVGEHDAAVVGAERLDALRARVVDDELAVEHAARVPDEAPDERAQDVVAPLLAVLDRRARGEELDASRDGVVLVDLEAVAVELRLDDEPGRDRG